jgi:ribosomal protein L11
MPVETEPRPDGGCTGEFEENVRRVYRDLCRENLRSRHRQRGRHDIVLVHADLCLVDLATGDLEKSTPIPTIITVYADRSFSFETKTPPATFLIKKAANLKSGSKEPGKVSAGKIKRSELSKIAEVKMKDLNANDIDAATRIIEGSARAMGLEVVEG